MLKKKEVGAFCGRVSQAGETPVPTLHLNGLLKVYIGKIIFLNIDLIAHILILVTNEFIK